MVAIIGSREEMDKRKSRNMEIFRVGRGNCLSIRNK